MLIGRVTGSIWSTRKDEKLNGIKLMVVELEGDNSQMVAADYIGAGEGDRVLIVTGGASRKTLGDHLPIDASIIGIIDEK